MRHETSGKKIVCAPQPKQMSVHEQVIRLIAAEKTAFHFKWIYLSFLTANLHHLAKQDFDWMQKPKLLNIA